ncbi:Modification methylase VspI [Fusobacterium necrogenes]|uniref:site-specific DNA-methyltransferase (adenine-specific) n=1 Tax=Fusobacterium necrogenes TaxID=858 RepID=A0A377GXH6_9FUSO|nr:TaqI-like C-terminal specificity domain-containing protein [Fusobacterium necrogenes]STO31658.1 Modification methylase VspI [Fusobacterium necrogenes]
MEKRYNYKVYTPNKIAEMITIKALTNYFRGDITEKKLLDVRVCDLSCGSGNLLLPFLEYLILLTKDIMGRYYYNPEWIKGCDIDEGAIKIIKRKGEELLKKYSLQGKIAIEKIDGLMLEGRKYNIILGNPPYLGEKNNKELFQKIKNTDFGMKYYEAKMDYLYFFVEKAIELLEDRGILVYLTTNYWLKADSAKKLRKALKENGEFLEIVFYNSSLFSKAKGQHNIIFSWEKTKKLDKNLKIELPEKIFNLKNSELYDENLKIVLADRESREYNRKVKMISNYTLGDLVNINQGIVSGYDKAFIFNEYQEKFKDYLKPFYKNKDIGKYTNKKNNFWILYLDRESELNEDLKEHLVEYYEKLNNRREVGTGRIKWWQLQWSRDKEIFSKPKILVRQRCKTNQFSYDEGEFYGSADIYFITVKNNDVDIFYILGYMNSTSFLQWFKYNGKIKGKNYEFYSTPLKDTPIYYPDDKNEIRCIGNLVKKQIKSYDKKVQEEIDRYFEKIFNK